jgi:hypothetical protein
MANAIFNRIRQKVTAAPGTGSIALGAAVSGYTTFAASLAEPASVSITNIVGGGVTAVATTAANHSFPVGKMVLVSGNTVPQFNRNHVITAVTSDTFTVKISTVATGTGGTVEGSEQFTVDYVLIDGFNFEIGRGTRQDAGAVLTRDTVYQSTNGGAKINASASAYVMNSVPAQSYGNSGHVRTPVGFWREVDIGTEIFRLPADRFFMGDAVKHHGFLSRPNGGDWLSDNLATYFMRHAQFACLTTKNDGRIAILGGVYVAPGQTAQVPIAIAAVAVNAGEGSTARAIYAEAAKFGNSADSMAIEVVVGDYRAVTPVVGPYGDMNSVNGIQISAEGGHGYLIGDSETALTAATKPGGAAIHLTGGTDAASNAARRFLTFLNVRDNSLYGETSSGLGGPYNIGLFPTNYQFKWMVSSVDVGAVLRSDRSTGAAESVGLIFKNKEIWLTGASERRALVVQDDVAGSGAVNWAFAKNSRTNIPVQFGANGSDTNVAVDILSHGASSVRAMAYDGGVEIFRATPHGSLDDVSILFQSALSGTSKARIAAYAAEASATGDDVNLTIEALNNGRVEFLDPIQLPSYAKAALPAAAVAGAMIYVTDDVGGAVPAFTDGTDWRRVTDRAVIA